MTGFDQDALPGRNEEEKVGVIVSLVVVALFACFFLVLLRGCGDDVATFNLLDSTAEPTQVADVDTAISDGGDAGSSATDPTVSAPTDDDSTNNQTDTVAVPPETDQADAQDNLNTDSGSAQPTDEPSSNVSTSMMITPTLDTAQSSGNSQTGHIQLFGSGQPGTLLAIIANDQIVGDAMVQEDGNWAGDVNLKPGDYIIYAQAVDDEGTLLQTGRVQFNVVGSPDDGSAGMNDGQDGQTQPPDDAYPPPDEATGSDTGDDTQGYPAEETPPAGDDDGQDGSATVFSTLATMPETALLAKITEISGLQGLLQEGDSPTTLFAPSDSAFSKLPENSLNQLLNDPAALQQLLRGHLVAGELGQGDLQNLTNVTTLNNSSLTVTNENGVIRVNGNQLGEPVYAGNSVIYIIEKLLLPAQNIAPPIIDESGVPTFEGDYLTVVGTAQPNSRLMLTINGEVFGETSVNEDGTWLVANNIAPGDYEIIAYTLDSADLPLAISNSVFLNVPAP